MPRTRRRLLIASLWACGALAVGAGLAWAFWTTSGSGAAPASVSTLLEPGAPVPSEPSGTVHLSWTAAGAPGPGAVTYSVERRNEPGTTWTDACGTSPTNRTPASTCDEKPGAGSYVWRVTAYFGTWTATSAESDVFVVDGSDRTPPTGVITAPAANANVRQTVAVTSDSADADSGVASARFQRSPHGAGTWTTIGVPDTVAPYGVSWDTTTVADGLYDLRVVTTDVAGNSFTSPLTTNVRVDNTAPTVVLSLAANPTGAGLVAGKLWFRSNAAGSYALVATVVDAGSGGGSATFPAQSATGWATHNAETVTTPTGGPFTSSAFSWVSGAATPGTYTVTVADAAGNTGTGAVTFGVDTTAPTGSITAPAASAILRGSVSVTSSSADSSSGVAKAQFQISAAGAGTWSNLGAPVTASPYTLAWDTTAVGDGLYDLRVVTTDNVGLTFTSATVTNVRVDNTPPTGVITAPLASAVIKGTYVVTSNSADGGSGVASVLFQRSPAGGNTWTNVAAADTTAPFSASWTTTTPGDGLYDLRVVTTDKAGNTFTSVTTNVRVDNTAPTGTVTAPAASANVRGTVAVTSNSADAGSGVATVQFQTLPSGGTTWSNLGAALTTSPYGTDWVTTSFADGLYSVRVVTTDNAGNVTTSAAIANVRVDNTAPTGAITAPSASANVRGTVTVTSSSADGGSGVASALFQVSAAGAGTWASIGAADTTTPYSTSWVTTGYTDGLYDLRVVTTDKAGNSFTSALSTNVRVDNTAPTVSVVVTAPVGASQSGQTVYFKANAAGSFKFQATVTDAGSGPASALFPALSATKWTTHTAETVTTPAGGPYTSTTFAWSSGAATPGTFTVTASDASGNTVTSAFTFTADTTAPTGSVTAPAASAMVRGAVTVTANSADAGAGVQSAQFQTSPAGAGTWTNLGTADTTAPYSQTWDTTTFADGLYDLRVVTTDNVGIASTSATITNVRVDNTAPTGSVSTPSGGAVVSGASVAVSSSSADSGSGVLSAQFQTSPSGAGNWTALGAADTTAPYGVTWNTTSGYPDGSYDLRVVTTDRAGNTFTSTVVTVVVQNGAAPAAMQLAAGGTAGRVGPVAVALATGARGGDAAEPAQPGPGDVPVVVDDRGSGAPSSSRPQRSPRSP